MNGNMNQQRVAGIFCGDRQTVALLANTEGSILARGVSSLASNTFSGIEGRLPAIEQAVDMVINTCGAPSLSLDQVWIGISGLGRRDAQEFIDSFSLEQFGKARLHISSEAELVLADGTPEEWGVAVCSGFTSLVVGKNLDGKSVKAGGWGSLLGEAGSAYSIGMLAVQHLTRAADGRINPTRLMDDVMSYWNLSNPRELYRKVYVEKSNFTNFINLAEVVFKAAGCGDKAALAILHQTACDLASLTAGAAKQLDLQAGFHVPYTDQSSRKTSYSPGIFG